MTGRHIYKDKKGEEKTVFVSYVLENISGEYVITQIGTAPQKTEDQERVVPQDSAPDSNGQ